ncbi:MULTISPECIES: sulfite exporter TauE/SafE family protein [unclassified Burkholderia]|uniref:sulfite exporter TauE/SafE family protein n=1 Tax=unclassified Burkholderia TaxID=2613784 RepID=UPI002AB185D4|nr:MULTISPECIES: sulfite exporter TauE/SafE family protein [unclassified Burkholderia]
MASLLILHGLASVLCGAAVSFFLALVGGGGSILAVPMMLYIVGLPNAHAAIGTAALAVAITAYLNMIPHAKAGNVRWRSALVFAGFGVVGAALGSSVGKQVDGQKLLVVFALLMFVVALLMLKPRTEPSDSEQLRPRSELWRVCGTGLGAGGLSGFFGIGGGFLVVPGLMLATRMRILDAIGSSLFAVGSFGLTTAINYSLAGQVNLLVAIEFVIGGLLGGQLGARSAGRLAQKRGALNIAFSTMIVVVAVYMLYQSYHSALR